jgi:hypothetical protein
MTMYGVDGRGNVLGRLERRTNDVWTGRLKNLEITAYNRAAAEMAMKKELGTTRVVVTEEPIHQVGVIIAV